jgi:hypothetical protein
LWEQLGPYSNKQWFHAWILKSNILACPNTALKTPAQINEPNETAFFVAKQAFAEVLQSTSDRAKSDEFLQRAVFNAI